MALVSIVVTFFSQTPIDFLLMGVTAVCTILVYTGKNLIELLRSDSPSGSLSFINLVSALLVVIGTGALESVGLYLIEGAINWSILGKVVLSVTFTYLGGTWFAGPYSTEKKRLFASKSYIRSLRKVVTILFAVMAFGTLSAQGFVKDVTPERIAQKQAIRTRSTDTLVYNGQHAWFLRGGLTVSYKKIYYSKAEGKLIGEDYNRPGVGLEFAKYEVFEGTSLSDIGFGGYFMIPVKDLQNYPSALVSVQIYDLGRKLKMEFLPPGLSVGGGFCYDFNNAVPTIERLGFVPNLSIKF